jgi:hypothetical protein
MPKERLKEPKTYLIRNSDTGELLRWASGVPARIQAWTKKSAKHTIKRMYGDGWMPGEEAN